MKTLLWLILAAVCIYCLVGALMYFGQRALTYFPEKTRTPPSRIGFPQADELELETRDGERVIVWHVAPRGDNPVVVYFHGNGGALRYRVSRFRALAAEGFGVVAVSYRGYGGSSGTPSEAGLIEDGNTAYRFAADRYRTDRLALWGESLGTAIAIAVASENPVGGVILEAPFTSVADVGQRAYWFMPVRLFLKDQFRSDLRIGEVTAPVLVLHGDADKTVPIVFGEELYALIKGRKHFMRFAGGAHNDLDRFGAYEAVVEFLKGM